MSSKVPEPKEHLDGYLTRKIRKKHPGAEVWKYMKGREEQWVLKVPGQEPIGIGKFYKGALQTVEALLEGGDAA